jgi:hypothetical protein
MGYGMRVLCAVSPALSLSLQTARMCVVDEAATGSVLPVRNPFVGCRSTQNGDYPLHLACKRGNAGVLRMLVENGVKSTSVNEVRVDGGDHHQHSMCSARRQCAVRVAVVPVR